MKETQKAKIIRLEKELQLQIELTKQERDQADMLYDKLMKLQEQPDIEFSASPHFHQLTCENEKLKYKIELLEDKLKKVQKKSDAQIELIEKFRTKQQHNARGAGRKRKFDEDQIQYILKLKQSGKSMNTIAKEVNCSVGLVHKIIHEQS